KNSPEFKHLYYTYAHVSDIYVKQERYNDAVITLKYFARHEPNSKYVPEALLKAISIWKTAGFASKMNEELGPFYSNYHPDSPYWHSQKNVNQRIYNLIKDTLREYILSVTANYHKQYLLTKNNADFVSANNWYQNYLRHYKSYSRKDNIHYLFGTLLAEHHNYSSALQHFELAAYDSEIIINSDAAYESIIIASKLARASKDKRDVSRWLSKLIHYSTLYSQQNPNDQRAQKILAHASELAYQHNMFKETVALAELITDANASLYTVNLNTIKAHSYVKLQQYENAETTYLAILANKRLKQKYRTPAINGLALSIYYQGKTAVEQNQIQEAIQHYARIVQTAPSSSIAATGMYDAIALSMQNELWEQAIRNIKLFQRYYPQHKHSRDVAKKLSVAYLNSKQDIAAARELEQISKHESDKEYKRAALWKAGELYQSKNEYRSAIRSYQQYAKNFQRPYPEFMESLYKLVKLNTIVKDARQANHWQKQIVRADKKTPTSLKNDRTKLIASEAALHLARSNHQLFSDTRLVLPLKQNLRKKKKAMQQSVNLYGRASSYGLAETATEATYAIGEIYREFSKALLDSERPRHLNATELEQYQILLEDQAFPFEEKAIEFYEINLTHVKDDIYDEWVQQSLAKLRQLFPVRYQREAKLEGYINVLH
ncbi:MAG: hypothetical protein PVG75_13585, partial [Thioalkalispiraceae bacterium]